MVSLDHAGKTTILYRLKLGQLIEVIPTIGFNCEEVTYGGITFTIWDVGGGDKIRTLWHQYLDPTGAASQALIFAIDCNDRDRMEEAKYELIRFLSFPETNGMKVLVYANKQDIAGAMTGEELSKYLDLDNVPNAGYRVQPSCAKTGEGLMDGLKWLEEQMK